MVKRNSSSASLEEVFERTEGMTPLAKALGITIQAVSQWRRVPVSRVLEIERLTGIPRSRLRPDVYPDDGSAS